MIELELLIQMIIFALGGYAIGRTITQESLFEEFRGWLHSKTYYDTSDPDIFQDPNTGEIVRRVSPTEFEMVSKDGYRTDIPRWRAFILGKVGDLFGCPYCLSANAALQLALWSLVVPLLPLTISVMFAAVGVTYVINDFWNKRIED